jgi:hypothetical protein
MRRFLEVGIILLLLSFAVILSGQDSSNLYDRKGIITERGLHGTVPEENIVLLSSEPIDETTLPYDPSHALGKQISFPAEKMDS